MDYSPSSIPLILFLLVLSLLYPSSTCSTFTITNNCPHVIWPGTLAGSGTPELPTTGFKLDPGRSVQLPAPPGWSGRIWARTGCDFNAKGAGTCQTGDCGGKMECGGMGALPPATLFEVTLGKGTDQDFYDVSLVDGYNLPIYTVPRGATAPCNATGCATDLNSSCPKELQVKDGIGVVACKSACEAFGLDQYCCSGQFANPTTCKPSFYSTVFKAACPRAYSYAFDDGTSTFTCKAADYAIVFCPNIKGLKRSDGDTSGQPTGAGAGAGAGVFTGQPSGSSTGQAGAGAGAGAGVSTGQPSGSSTGQASAGAGISTGQQTGSSRPGQATTGAGVSTWQPTGTSSSTGTQPNYWEGNEGGAQEISSGTFLLFDTSFTISIVLFVSSVVI